MDQSLNPSLSLFPYLTVVSQHLLCHHRTEVKSKQNHECLLERQNDLYTYKSTTNDTIVITNDTIVLYLATFTHHLLTVKLCVQIW